MRLFSACGFALLFCLFLFPQPTAGRIETITRRLTSPEFNGRAFRSEGGRKAAEYIAAQFRESGLSSVQLQPIAGAGQNVIGIIEGRRKDEYVLLGAHYDAFGGPFTGARDGAAPVAAMIEAARLAATGKPERSLVFVAFDGDEQRQAGLQAWLSRPPVPLEKTIAALNLHNLGSGMGEKQPETLYVTGAEFSPQLREAVVALRNSEAHLALLGTDVMEWPGNDHARFAMKEIPTLSITNGVHYSFHSRHDTPHRIDFPALDKHAATLARLLLGIAAATKRIERQTAPAYDADESAEWQRLLTALREQVLKTPENQAGQARIDDTLFELKRLQGRPVQDPKARDAVLRPAANLCMFMAHPAGVDYLNLHNRARNDNTRDAWQRLLKFVEEEYRLDDQTTADIRARAR
ncbi:MAG: M28 family peptidase [Blastocatellia bacterium]|nr:M28 family peptidase [Blastocatellia bacterium]